MNSIIYVIASILLVTVSQLLFKKGVSQLAGQPKPPGQSRVRHLVGMVFQPMIFGGLFLNGLAAIFWLLALSRLELSYIFPFLSLNYILIPVGAALFLGEHLSRYRRIGIAIICGGIFLVALSGF